MKTIFEKPFSLLRRMENGKEYDEDTVNNWYMARAFVLDMLKNVSFEPKSSEHLHVVIKDDSPLLLSVARQVALTAHYLNFNEEADDETKRNRTVITIVSKNSEIKSVLEKEEYLCNLPKFCKFVKNGSDPLDANSFLDIEIHIVEEYQGECQYVITEENVMDFCESTSREISEIDTAKAIYASRMYDLGSLIDNLPSEDIHCAERYNLALDVYQYERLGAPLKPLFNDKDSENQCKLKEKLSNVFCADCFASRYNGMKNRYKDSNKKERKQWEENNEILSKSEHARWVVEKLIMGYSPLSESQRFIYDNLFYDKNKQKEYRNSLKQDSYHPAHIDLCSYNDLRRINPDDLKYDSFLMLAIPKILEKVDGND